MDQAAKHLSNNKYGHNGIVSAHGGEVQVVGSNPGADKNPACGNGKAEERHGAAASVAYRECLKNHAASIGSHAVDGCGEFMPRGAEGTEDAMKCMACGCHRNFHRRDADGEAPLPPYDPYGMNVLSAPYALGNLLVPVAGSASGTPMEQLLTAPTGQHEGGDGQRRTGLVSKKRFRTKFTAEQKEKMYGFAERIGWRIQKQDEAAVQRFCEEAGVRRHVLKVWMHNNKNNLAKKS